MIRIKAKKTIVTALLMAWLPSWTMSQDAVNIGVQIKEIKQFNTLIDSLAELHGQRQKMVILLREGNILETIESKGKDHGEKVTSTVKGGFSAEFLTNVKGDSLYRVRYHNNLHENFYETYYYKANLLVYGKIRYEGDGAGTVFYWKESWFDKQTILLSDQCQHPIKAPYLSRASFDLYEKGNQYLKEYMEKHKPSEK